LEAAVQGSVAAIHAESLGEVIRAVRERSINAVFVSPRCVELEELPRVAALVEGFPTVATVALVARHDAASSRRLLDLGAYGVRRMVDVSDRLGWQHLRDLISNPTSPTAARIFAKLIPALGDPALECRALFETVVSLAPSLTTVRSLADHLRIPPSTFMSRFFRAGLPSPKRYLAGTRLLYAAALLEIPALSLSDVAYQLQYSSPQSFGRHLRTVLGMTATEFRARYSFDAALVDFVGRLIVPYRTSFRTFYPLNRGVGYLGQRG
jgi:AraC-like DNA-binding protein